MGCGGSVGVVGALGCDESCGLELLGVVKWCEFGGERKRRKGGEKNGKGGE